ncbi:hypothetical protein [Methylobacterium sp. B4]|uniref:WD40/YVTN/BNR-like repeat-containing protein n=1 Tax=Methylobacterium sp. B4 TaxID=1938755 RepID=UPI000D9BCFE1|nr:hypothetical protein [Methylobacterium sp. B4]PXW50186.1 hypothetical protein BY998_1483 [Methylobacterium sp. B4]
MAVDVQPTHAAPSSGQGDLSWRPIKIGAGGFLAGLDIAPDGVLTVRTDTYGAYIWDPADEEWRQLVTRASMPGDMRFEEGSGDLWPTELVIAPSQSSRLYMALDGWLFRSDDAGRRWIRTKHRRIDRAAGATEARAFGRKMAVDPRNADIVCAGGAGFVSLTTDGGANWVQIRDLPAPSGMADGFLVIFDPSSPDRQGRTMIAYAASWSNGVYRSDDACRSWRPLGGGPTSVRNAALGRDGTLFVAGHHTSGGASGVFRYNGSWRDVTPPSETPEAWHSVTVCPRDPARIIAAKEDGSLSESLDGGDSWGKTILRDSVRRVAIDVPWLAWTDESWMTNGDMRFHPIDPDRLVFAQGVGAWTAPFLRGARSLTWTSMSRGIEQLVANQCVHPPVISAKPVLACWDRALFFIDAPDRYPERHYPDPAFAHCWGVDYASSDPSFLVATISSQQASDLERSAYSVDSGRNWQPLPSTPGWKDGLAGKGFIAASSPTNFVWAPGDGRGAPHVTQDGGRSWRPCNLPGVGDRDFAGFGAPPYLRRYTVCADRRAPNVFYMVHFPKGLFVSTDGGLNWSLFHPLKGWNEPYHSKLRAVPGHAGHLFHTSGHSSAPRYGAFIRSTDHGRSFSPLPNVVEVSDFAFGKPASGSTYPAIYIVGYVGEVWGVHRSLDAGRSWHCVSDGHPLGRLDRILAIEADKNEFGRIYLGFAGSGWTYGVV